MAASLYDEEEIQKSLPVGHNIIKASLFNLIVLSHDPERTSHCEELINIIVEKFPCRVIFVKTDPNAQADFLRTSYHLLTVGAGEHKVFCDLISIEGAAQQSVKIPFLVLPHIVPDLPVFILVGHDPTQDLQVVQEIEKYATRLIFDPETIDNFGHFATRLLDASKRTHCEFFDMNWSRMRGWREIIAQVFSPPDAFHQLDTSKMIQINYALAPKKQKLLQEMQAVYLQAWLASRLNWKLIGVEKQDREWRIFYSHNHGGTTISLIPRDTDVLQAGAIFSFEAMTYDDFHFLITHETERKFVKVHASNKERCEMPYTVYLSNFQSGASLVNDIFYQPQSSHYAAALSQLSNDAWARA